MVKWFSGDGLKARFMRSTGWRTAQFFLSQMLRLLSNLLLTRLLFPEAFGLMALVTLFLTGLMMFSDTGIVAAIQQNKRGDDPQFLDTARTIQIIRGGILWTLTWPLGWAGAWFYEAPELAFLLPAAGVVLIINGFNPTRVYTAQRNLTVGRLTAIELAGNVIGILLALAFAWWLRSVWALVFGMVLTQAIVLTLFLVFLKGRRDRLLLDPDCAHELLHFGKWIFLSTICGFLSKQGDRLILGKYLTLEMLGIYNIAFFLASVPSLLGSAVLSKVMLPYLREKPPGASRANFLALRRVRALATGGLLLVALLLALAGPYLVHILYDSRYHAAAGIMVLICLATLPQLILQGYAKVPLVQGDSHKYTWVMFSRSVLNVAFLLGGVAYAGMSGAIIGLGVARLLHYPIVTRVVRRYGAWDPVLDAGFLAVGGLGALGIFLLHQHTIAQAFSL